MSLAIQDTPGNDQAVVWCIRSHSEGVNLVSNGTFDSGSNWTANTDWIIGSGVATYDFAGTGDPEGDLDQTVSAVLAVPYVLEYEVISVSGSGFLCSLTGGFSTTVPEVTVLMDLTVGFHRIDFFGHATATLVRFHAESFGSGDILVIDNVKIRKAVETAYLSTVTLSLDNTYDGKVLEFSNRISNINEFMDVQSSGSVSGVSSFTITIARYGANTKFDGFFNEFFPDEDGGTLTAREIDIGVVWDNATTDTEITWLMRGKVVDYRYEPRQMVITVLQSTEIDSRSLPFYTVQKDFDNEVSYFTNAPAKNYGQSLPIVYGSFNLFIDTGNQFRPLYSPLMLVDKHKLEYIAATHKVETDSMSSGGASNLFTYLSGIDSVMTLTCANGSSTNNDIRAFVTTFDTLNNSDNVVSGSLSIRPTLPGSKNDIADYSNLTNDDNTDELTLTSLQECSLMIDGSEPNPGILSQKAASIAIRVVQSDSVTADASNDTVIRYWNPEFNSGVGGYGTANNRGWNTGDGDKTHSPDISTDFAGRDLEGGNTATTPWGWDDLFNLEYIVQSASGYTNKYKELWLIIINIIVADTRKEIKVQETTEILTYEQEGTSPFIDRITSIVNKTVYTKAVKPIDNAFGKLEGREYGRWIDFADKDGTTREVANGDATDPGFAENALITTPGYVIESFFRDEIFVERDLQIDSTASTTTFVCTGVISREDDYYNNAELYNASRTGVTHKSYVTDYVGSTATFTINDAITGMAAGDNIYLTNIQGDNKIDTNSFDIIGSETNGTRRSLLSGTAEWVFARSLATKLSHETIMNQLCFESHCQLFESINPNTALPQIKIVAIDAATSADTWTSPVKNLSTGLPMVSTSLTPLTNVFTSFRLFYWWNYGKQEYEKELFVDENGTPSAATILDDYEQLLCRKAKSTYRVENPFVYSANWIYNTNTAERLLQKKIRYFTKQRLVVNWTTGISDGTFDYIAAERGDQVKLNFSNMIPAGLNNSAFFMITSKRIVTVQGSPVINWTLLEME